MDVSPAAASVATSPAAGQGRSAARVAIAIVLSRLVGLVRQRITAHYFGTSSLADVIAAAFRIGNLAQNLLGEGTLSATFIPAYAKLRAEGREQEARAFARSALGALAALAVIVSAAGIAAAPWLTVLCAGGFRGEKLAFTIELVRWLFPMTGMLVLSAWALGVLNAHRSFFVPYAAPVLWSAAQIAALLIAGSWLAWSEQALALALAYGALGGAAITLGLLLVRARRVLGSVRPSFNFHNPTLREAAARFPSALVGRGMIQISGLIDTLLVSLLGSGAVASFHYAQMIYLMPMSVLGTAEAAAALPEMAGDSAESDSAARNQRIRDRLVTSLTRVVVLAVPAMVLLCLLGEELLTLLFYTGRFDRDSIRAVATPLLFYGFALLGNASVRLFQTAFFALGDTRTPARFALVRVVASTLVSLLLMKPLGVAGVVIGAMTAAWIEALLLARSLRHGIDSLGLARLPLARIVALALACALPPAAAKLLLGHHATEPWIAAAVLALAAGMFVVAAAGLRLVDLRSLIGRGRDR